MISEQQQITIAELCGWWGIHKDEYGNLVGGMPEQTNGEPCFGIPRYGNCLNVCHKMEQTLKGGMRSRYDAELGIIAERDHCFIWETTAEQRCEAFLRTHEKWQETKR